MNTMTAVKLEDRLAPVDSLIAEAQAGRPVVLVDDENRENEGDLIIPAAKVTPQIINFMAMHGRGLICMPVAGEIADRLNLKPMTDNNTAKYGTAFTVSIGAKEGITTGISAYDRARTVQVAANPASGPDDITTPGHIFPLRARDGGVCARAGHTEAAVDLARLAGFEPAGVLCEVMKDDGTMARLPDLLVFAANHGLKVGTIAALAACCEERP